MRYSAAIARPARFCGHILADQAHLQAVSACFTWPCMTKRSDEFDAFITGRDAESQDWCDGMDGEDASALLRTFAPEDWAALIPVIAHRPPAWRACLVSALEPCCPQACNLMLLMTNDPDETVAFEALQVVMFYCGVNSRADGHFFDASIVNAPIVSRARAMPSLPTIAEEISVGCSAYHRGRIALFLGLLERNEG